MIGVNILLSIGSLFFQTFVFMVVWNWFPSQIFDIKSIEYAESYGLMLVVSFFKGKHFNLNETPKDDFRRITGHYYYMIFVLIIASIIKTFI
jgi:hypothetical protein